MWVHAYGSQRLTLGVFQSYTRSNFLGQALSLNLNACHFGEIGWPSDLKDPPLVSISPALESQVDAASPGLYMGAGNRTQVFVLTRQEDKHFTS